MPDLSMCLNKSCPIKDKCVRYRAVPNEHRQSYSSFNFTTWCPDFISIRDTPYKLREVRNG